MTLIDQMREAFQNLYSGLENEFLINLLVSLTMITLWVLFATLIRLFVRRLVGYNTKSKYKQTREQLTANRLIVNIVQFFFYFWIAIMILRELGIDIIPVIAGAGVVAFAIGFGAQELIKDFIAGMFLIGEKTFSIGDYIEIGPNSGTITDVGLRRIKIETWKGEVITINNGDIRTIKNYSVNPGVAVIEFKTPANFDLQELENKDFKAFLQTFMDNNKEVLAMPEKVLLVDMNDGLKFALHIKTNIRKYTSVEREFRKELVNYFQKRNINIVVPLLISENK